jgi:hypothetical protein
LQTSQVCKELGKHLKIQVMVTTGGTSLKDDIIRLYQPVHLLVGTPGRILDLTKKGVCILKDCSMLIMDEVCIVSFVVMCECLLFINKLTLYFAKSFWSTTLALALHEIYSQLVSTFSFSLLAVLSIY